jgi:hypothetical protein
LVVAQYIGTSFLVPPEFGIVDETLLSVPSAAAVTELVVMVLCK